MGEVKHTPGPWRLRTNRHAATNGESWGWVSENTDANISLPGLSRFEWQGDTGRANARLIAACPDLLEALKALQLQALQSPDLLKTEWGQEALEVARAAIAKATGSDQ